MPMVKKIIDFIFPIVALPEDEEKRALVIKSYEGYSKNSLPIWPMPIFLLFPVASITQVFSICNIAILICILIPTLLFVISAILLLKYRVDHKSTHENLLGILLDTYGIISGIAIMLYVIFVNNYIEINIYISILILSLFAHNIGYWHMLRNFNKRMVTAKTNQSMAGVGIFGASIGGLIAKLITYDMENFLLIFMFTFFMITLPFLSSAALVNYRQYDNIQCAKNGEPFK